MTVFCLELYMCAFKLFILYTCVSWFLNIFLYYMVHKINQNSILISDKDTDKSPNLTSRA